ncbi:hypothetical protein EWE76_27605, partial [Klebsiella pneumoniae]|nr:hypothetical protein [Klebsiella pneumoniae]
RRRFHPQHAAAQSPTAGPGIRQNTFHVRQGAEGHNRRRFHPQHAAAQSPTAGPGIRQNTFHVRQGAEG